MKFNQVLAVMTLVISSPWLAAKEEVYSPSVTVKQLFKTTTTSEGKALAFPAAPGEVTGIEVTIPAGSSTGWHTHTFSGFAYVLSGKLQVTTSDSTKRVFGPGEAFAEVVGTAHEGSAVGKEDVRLVAFFLTEKGKPVSIKE